MELGDYLEEIKKIELLNAEAEASLWQLYKECDDQKARQVLIESYQPLVFKAVAPFKSAETVMDIVQEGTVGLIEAVENYDYRRGVAFSLYAFHRIRGRMLNFIRKEGAGNLTYIDSSMYNGESDFMPSSHLIDDSVNIEKMAEERFLARELKNAMHKLPFKEQQVLNGVYLHDRQPKQMAEQMAVSTSHIYRLQKQGIRRIRGIMSKFMQHW